MLKKLLSLATISLSFVSLIAQPANDLRENAKTITPNNSCNVWTGTNVLSYDLKDATSDVSGQKDVWFKFTAENFVYELNYVYDSRFSFEVKAGDQHSGYIKADVNENRITVPELGLEYYIRFWAYENETSGLQDKMCFSSLPGNWTKETAKLIDESTSSSPVSKAFDGAEAVGPAFSCDSDTDGYQDIWFKFEAKSDTYDVYTRTTSGQTYKVEIFDESDNSLDCGKGMVSSGYAEKTLSITTEVGKTYYVHAAKSPNSADLAFGISITPTGSAVTGVEKSEKKIKVSPLPAKSVLNIIGINAGTAYSIIDMKGAFVAEGQFNGENINISSLLAGVYKLSIGIETITFIKAD